MTEMEAKLQLHTVVPFAARGDAPLFQELDEKLQILQNYEDVDGDFFDFDEETGVATIDISLSTIADCDIDLSGCSQEPNYYDPVMEQWYPGDYNWDPKIDCDLEGLADELKESLKDMGAVGTVAMTLRELIGSYDGTELDEYRNDRYSFSL